MLVHQVGCDAKVVLLRASSRVPSKLQSMSYGCGCNVVALQCCLVASECGDHRARVRAVLARGVLTANGVLLSFKSAVHQHQELMIDPRRGLSPLMLP